MSAQCTEVESLCLSKGQAVTREWMCAQCTEVESLCLSKEQAVTRE